MDYIIDNDIIKFNNNFNIKLYNKKYFDNIQPQKGLPLYIYDISCYIV